MGMDEWAAVERRHLLAYPDHNRTRESLRRKFQTLYLTKKATGDPTCPPEVRRAKQLQQAIREKAEVSSAGSEISGDIDFEVNQVSVSVRSDDQNQNVAKSNSNQDDHNQQAPSVQAFTSTSISQPGSKRRKRSTDDDDDISMEDLLRYSMVQQQ